MTKKTYANKLGISPSQLSQWLPEGLPGPPDVKAGLRWIRREQGPQRSRRSGKSLVTAQPRAKAKRSLPVVLGDSWPDRVERAREMEKSSYRAYLVAVQEGQSAQLERLQAAHVRSIATVADVEQRAMEAHSKTGDLLRREDVRSMMMQLLTPLREALDKLPLSERTNANPANPEIAERALTEWRLRFLTRCNNAEFKFNALHVTKCPTTSIASEPVAM